MEQRAKFKKKLWSFMFFAVLIVSVFSIGYLLGQSKAATGFLKDATNIINTEKGKPDTVDFSLFWEAYNSLNESYVEKIDSQDLLYGAILGLTSATKDPYTIFLRPDERQRFQDDIAGVFDGIGVEISLLNGLPTVVSPLSDSPAQKAGIKPKDIIFEVDGTKTSEIGFEETINQIRGEKGTKVSLTVIREGESDPLTVEVIRDTIVVASVSYELQAESGKSYSYIKIRQFGDDTFGLFKEAAERAKSDNPDAIILDLRNNPGGYLDVAIDISSFLIDGGVIVSEVGKSGAKKDYKTTKSPILKDYKLAVLVNEGSASASEIVAGAVKDRGRGEIVGKNTFGKGSVQAFETLSDTSAVKITIAKWLTPNSTHIDSVGIAPSFEIEDNKDTEVDEVILKAKEILSD